MTQPLWGVGAYDDPGGRAAWPISHDEIGRDIGVATSVLGELGERGAAGGRVLICSMLREAGQFWPYVVGTVLAGGQLSCSDATEGEATRVAMFTRLMEYEIVLGVNGAILDGLDTLGRGYADVFGRVGVLGARPDAYERLCAVGLTPFRVVVCGPTIAIGRAPGGPAFVPCNEWELHELDGRILVSSRLPRAQEFARTPTAVRGELVDGGVIPHPENPEDTA